jgi:hypothetical protein
LKESPGQLNRSGATAISSAQGANSGTLRTGRPDVGVDAASRSSPVGSRATLLIHLAALVSVVVLGAAAAAFGALRHFVNEDGLAYLDMADIYRTDGWAAGTNGYWSPLYPLLLAAALRIVRPALEWELVVVQAANLAILLCTFAAFVWFWREVDRVRGRVGPTFGSGSAGAVVAEAIPADEAAAPGVGVVGDGVRDDSVTFPAWIFWSVGYLLFLWCSFRLIKIWTMSPDMLMMASVLAAGALLLRMRTSPSSWLAPAGLGLVLGLGYLAKAPMFPLGLVLLAGSLGVLGFSRASWLRLGLAVLVFATVAAPFLVTLSAQKGRFTFGDSGRLNYARYVNGIPHVHWQGEVVGSGTPVHPTRRIATAPAAFEFAAPVAGTYPVWYDPSFWYEGVQLRFDAAQQAAALVRTGRYYMEHVGLRQGAAIAALVLLYAVIGRRRRYGLDALGRLWPIWLPGLAAAAMYGLVYIEMRYLAGFVVLMWGAALAAVAVPASAATPRLLRAAGLVAAFVFALNLGLPNDKALGRLLFEPQPAAFETWHDHGVSGSRAYFAVAEALHEVGLVPGDGVAFIGYGYDAYWARLAGLRIVAELPRSQEAGFWRTSESERARIVATLLGTGAAAVITVVPPQHLPPEGWQRLGRTAYYAVRSW